ncbi:uncharacterized protein PG998_011662 [Apiospora kogelbergensis]|uniref:Uncharacterized protein n=1 Tax=Apiospora kogelbergensis TaxID=1337665 RepID=A0AAW0RBD2_9PEZI
MLSLRKRIEKHRNLGRANCGGRHPSRVPRHQIWQSGPNSPARSTDTTEPQDPTKSDESAEEVAAAPRDTRSWATCKFAVVVRPRGIRHAMDREVEHTGNWSNSTSI